jgi:hypothetical protein
MAELRQSGSRVNFVSMRRPIVFAVLSFLLLFMQQEAQVHALSHLGPQLARAHETQILVPHADSACVECALLAAGTSTATSDPSSLVFAVTDVEPAWVAFRSHPADAPAYYSSRAPPVLL